MSNRNITKVSLEEINQALGKSTIAPSATESAPYNPDPRAKNNSYVVKLKNQEIIDFFRPFGFITLVRQTEWFPGDLPAIQVICKDFITAISDYDVVVTPNYEKSVSQPLEEFDTAAFVKYCDSIGMTPEEALEFLVVTEFLGPRFHSYAKNYSERKQKERKESTAAFEKLLPKSVVGALDAKREHDINSIENKLKYGSLAGDPQIKI